MSDSTAIVAVVTSGAVALGVAGLTGFLELRRERREERRERRGELHDVLDNAGAAVSEAVVAAQQRVVAGDRNERERTGVDFNAKFASVQLFENRIRIRVDKSESASASYRDVVKELRGLRKELYDARGELDPEQQKAANETISRVEAAHDTYLDHAGRLMNRDT